MFRFKKRKDFEASFERSLKKKRKEKKRKEKKRKEKKRKEKKRKEKKRKDFPPSFEPSRARCFL